jgi:hypothetical protein
VGVNRMGIDWMKRNEKEGDGNERYGDERDGNKGDDRVAYELYSQRSKN